VILPEDVRVDTWIETGSEVSAFYDPLLAKIIVHGGSRQDALARLDGALAQTRVHGIETNLDYLRTVVSTPTFRGGGQFTRFLSEFAFPACSVEVLRPGTQATVQDHPGSGMSVCRLRVPWTIWLFDWRTRSWGIRRRLLDWS
jgi:urea carboxylase